MGVMMKLEPVAWSVTWEKTHCGNFFFREEDAKEHAQRLDAKYPDESREVVALVEETQLRAEIERRDAVLRMALEVFSEVAGWESEGDPEHPASKAIKAIKEVLG